jgi:sec-independent protein translocase protein TatA
MGTFSIWHWVIVLLVVLVLFGAGKIPRLMGDVAKGVNAFKKGLNDDGASDTAKSDPKTIEGNTAAKSTTVNKERDEEAAKG